jgi:predicted transposase YbfD/YdcC
MDPSPLALITVHFADLPDPRVNRTKIHDLMNILTIALCAALSGAENWSQVEEYGWAKLAFLRQFLDLPADPEAIPSHDTFERVFEALDPVALERCLLNWSMALAQDLAGEVVAIDGKTLRRSLDRRSGKHPLHLVSAWASQAGLVLGQVATEDKSNEITAIPELLEMLDLQGATVTIDAMGCQKDIAAKILEKKGDYVLAVKDNHPLLHQDVQRILAEAMTPGDPVGCRHHQTIDKGHGRLETRQVWCTPTKGRLFLNHQDQDWPGLASAILVESRRTVDGQTTIERRYYISSHEATSPHAAKHLGHMIRSHWGIENRLHWVLDMTFDEDRSRVRRGHGARNLAVLRKIALNLLRRETSSKTSLVCKRHRAGWDDAYLLKILSTRNLDA